MEELSQRAIVLSQSPHVIALLALFGLLAGIEITLRYTALAIRLFSGYLSFMQKISKRAVRRILQMNLRRVRAERICKQYGSTIRKGTMAPIGIILLLGWSCILLAIWKSKINIQFYTIFLSLIIFSIFYIYGRYMLWFVALAEKDADVARDFALSALRKIKR